MNFAGEASIVISPVDYTIDESATMVAVCVGTGFPVPSISWSLDGSPLENNSRVSIYEEVIVESGITFVQSFLEVCSVGFMDAGLYQCTVANRLANASSNFTLTINRVGGELQCCTHLLWQCYTTTILYAKILFPIWIFLHIVVIQLWGS